MFQFTTTTTRENITMSNRNENIHRMIRAARLDAYQAQHCGSTSEHAERQLQGRTHYYDAGTRRYFGCRVLDVVTDPDGAVFGTVESVAAPSGRRYRAVVFDLFGTVIHRTESDDHGFKTKPPARKELVEFLRSLDVEQITRDALEHRARMIERDAAELRAAL